MKQLSTPAKLIWLFTMLVFFGSCAPKYGLHFQPSHGDSYAEKAPISQTITANNSEANMPSMALVKPVAPELTNSMLPTDEYAETSEAPLQNLEEKESLVLSKKEQRQMVRQLRKKLKNMSAEDREALREQAKARLEAQKANPAPVGSGASGADPVLLVILAILLPPLAVYLYEGDTTNKFWISLLLTLLFFLPGIIYALLVIFGEI